MSVRDMGSLICPQPGRTSLLTWMHASILELGDRVVGVDSLETGRGDDVVLRVWLSPGRGWKGRKKALGVGGSSKKA